MGVSRFVADYVTHTFPHSDHEGRRRGAIGRRGHYTIGLTAVIQVEQVCSIVLEVRGAPIYSQPSALYSPAHSWTTCR
jgi:hypothetical protein